MVCRLMWSFAQYSLRFSCANLDSSSCSANVSVADSPFVVQRTDAVDVVEKSPKFGDALPIEPIGMYQLLCILRGVSLRECCLMYLL